MFLLYNGLGWEKCFVLKRVYHTQFVLAADVPATLMFFRYSAKRMASRATRTSSAGSFQPISGLFLLL